MLSFISGVRYETGSRIVKLEVVIKLQKMARNGSWGTVQWKDSSTFRDNEMDLSLARPSALYIIIMVNWKCYDPAN